MKSGLRWSREILSEDERQNYAFLFKANFATLMTMVGLIGFAALSDLAFGGEADLNATILIQVYNYSQASPATLAEAEREAGRIFGEAGVTTVWLECPVRSSTFETPETCKKTIEATDIRLRIMDAPPVKIPDNIFGMAIHPALATVYYEHAMRRARSDAAEFEAPIILGCIMAHELGHLLLGSNSHSEMGIMQGKWKSYQLRQLVTGTLLFTTEQSEVMRRQARKRMEP